METQTEYVTIDISDGTCMRAYLAQPAEGSTKSIILLQEIYGVNSHICNVAVRFAQEGYCVIAPELFHRTAPEFEAGYEEVDKAEGLKHAKAMKESDIALDLQATYQWLRDYHDHTDFPIATVGFCLGGRIAFQAALILPIRCAVSFYGGGIAANSEGPGLIPRADELKAPVLFVWGGQDPHITAEQRDSVVLAMRKAKKEFVNTEFSMASHGFFCDARAAYHPQAAEEAFQLTKAFIARD